MKKILLPLKIFLIGFAHIFVAYFAFFILAYLSQPHRGEDGTLIVFYILLPLTFFIATCFLYCITRKHGGYKWLWLNIVGCFVGISLLFVEIMIFQAPIAFFRIFVAIDRLGPGCMFGLALFYFFLVVFALTVLECLILYCIKLITWLKIRRKKEADNNV